MGWWRASRYRSAKSRHRLLVVPLTMVVTIFSAYTIASGYPRTVIWLPRMRGRRTAWGGPAIGGRAPAGESLQVAPWAREGRACGGDRPHLAGAGADGVSTGSSLSPQQSFVGGRWPVQSSSRSTPIRCCSSGWSVSGVLRSDGVVPIAEDLATKDEDFQDYVIV